MFNHIVNKKQFVKKKNLLTTEAKLFSFSSPKTDEYALDSKSSFSPMGPTVWITSEKKKVGQGKKKKKYVEKQDIVPYNIT